MNRAVDPLFPAILSRLGGKAGMRRVFHSSAQTTETDRHSVPQDLPRWDAPAHWIKPKSDW